MLFPEDDTPLVKAWIVKRLENNSDADADVLADYVLALLKHDGDVRTIRNLFEAEIPDFLREDAAAFTDDVLQVVKHKAYLPGVAPPPVRQRQYPATAQSKFASRPQILTPAYPAPLPLTHPIHSSSVHRTPTQAQAQDGSRKRSHSDHNEDVDIILTSRAPYSQPHKQARRGGNFGQRSWRHEDPYRPRGHQGPGPGPALVPFTGPPGLLPYGGTPLPIDANSFIENFQFLQSLLPSTVEVPKPAFSGAAALPSRGRKQRCRNYDSKGFCSRGNNCNFEHRALPSYDPSAGSRTVDEYDPTNASLPLPPFGLALPEMSRFDDPSYPAHASAARQDPKKPRKPRGRALFTLNGPCHDKTKTTIVVQNIPDEYLTADHVRGYFSQFGNVMDVTIQKHNRVALVKFDAWDAAHAAWSSPKVIFENRFVKVFWHRDDGVEGPALDEKHTSKTNKGYPDGPGHSSKSSTAEPEFDLDEFYRKVMEAQKLHEEKTKKRQEIEQARKELEARQKELREQQEEAKRQLQAKLAGNDTKERSLSASDVPGGSNDQPSTSQTEALRAQLAALEKEANLLGIDPEENPDGILSWVPRGGSRGRGYRGRGTFAPRATSGGYRYRGGGSTVEARHAAYAAYSLDNRPKVVGLSGVDFTLPENDEALRQYLFSVGEFKDVHATSEAAHVTFKDRKTAEKFMFGVSSGNSLPGIKGKIEPKWATIVPGVSAATGGAAVLGDNTYEHSTKEGLNNGMDDADSMLEEGEVDSGRDLDQGDMDYEAGEW
ncbi:hypothetical protein GGS20DRAFT_569069 [Poronia punctata]|nr:hypothetical protein GGS20DRAFT_569069 [Poronia punctata]